MISCLHSMWGLTAMYAYQAYQDQSFLANAISVWESFASWIISPMDAAHGLHPLRNTTFLSKCNGGSTYCEFFVRFTYFCAFLLASVSGAGLYVGILIALR